MPDSILAAEFDVDRLKQSYSVRNFFFLESRYTCLIVFRLQLSRNVMATQIFIIPSLNGEQFWVNCSDHWLKVPNHLFFLESRV